jgi:alpha-N-arabinofuranosidase
VLIAATLVSSAAFSQPHPITATTDTSKMGAPISKNIYGQFLEHGGDIVNTGVWAEMLVDRKFFIRSPPVHPPAGNCKCRRQSTVSADSYALGAPVGADDAVTMDTKSLYTGEHTPLVKLDAKEAHGLSESGIAVRKGKTYTGRIILVGTPSAVVKVALIWGREAADRQVITIRHLGSAYRKFPIL